MDGTGTVEGGDGWMMKMNVGDVVLERKITWSCMWATHTHARPYEVYVDGMAMEEVVAVAVAVE